MGKMMWKCSFKPKKRISILALSPDSRCFWCVRLNEKALCHSRTFCLKQAAGPYHLCSCPLVHIWRKNAVIPNHQIYYLSPWEYINHCPWMSAQRKPLSSPFTKPLPRLRQLLSYWYFQTFSPNPSVWHILQPDMLRSARVWWLAFLTLTHGQCNVG